MCFLYVLCVWPWKLYMKQRFCSTSFFFSQAEESKYLMMWKMVEKKTFLIPTRGSSSVLRAAAAGACHGASLSSCWHGQGCSGSYKVLHFLPVVCSSIRKLWCTKLFSIIFCILAILVQGPGRNCRDMMHVVWGSVCWSTSTHTKEPPLIITSCL